MNMERSSRINIADTLLKGLSDESEYARNCSYG